MPVDPRAFIKPPVAETSIYSGDNVILFAVAQEISQVELKWGVSIVVSTDKTPVDKDQDIAKGPIKLNRNSFAQVAGWNFEFASVPTYTGLWITPPERLESMRLHRLVAIRSLQLVAHEGQLDRPIMRQVYHAPLRIVELGFCEFEFAGSRKISLTIAESQISGWVSAVSELKLPAEIEQQLFARWNRSLRFRRCCIRIPGHQSGELRQG